MKQQLIEKLLRYVKVDTQSDPNSETFPSTMKQFDLQKILLEELKNLGIKDAELDDKCYLMATIPSCLWQSACYWLCRSRRYFS